MKEMAMEQKKEITQMQKQETASLPQITNIIQIKLVLHEYKQDYFLVIYKCD